jgi:two-component system, LytTR family, sensor histidine kinase AlgZ
MTSAGRVWLLLGLNGVMIVMAPLIRLGDRHGSAMSELPRELVAMLVYTNMAGIPAILAGPWLVERLALYKWPLAGSVLVTTLSITALACLSAQALLMWAGVAAPEQFWPQYFRTLRGALLFSLVFGFGAISYATMWDRLRRAEEKLHEKEIAEERTQKLATEARLRSLESRLHPHFLFNTLNSISALIAIDPARAEQIVGRLATLLRSSLDTTPQPLIPLGQELAMVEDYVAIERARFGDKLRGRVNVPDELRHAQVPPLSVQSLVENAVKHGITPQRSGGEVSVSASAENGQLRIEVSDTGAGFDLTAIRAGHGLDCLVGRLDALFSDRAHVHVSRREGRCVVEMVLPRS